MCDCLPSSPLSSAVTNFRELGFIRANLRPQNPYFYPQISSNLSNSAASDLAGHRNGRPLLVSTRASENSTRGFGVQSELGFKEKSRNLFDNAENGIESFDPSEEAKAAPSLGSDVVQSKVGLGDDDDEERNGESNGSLEAENRARMSGSDGGGGGGGVEMEEGLKHIDEEVGLRKGRQVMRRSGILAKQVISIRSALGLGFVSQLWVNTNSWMVMFVEVRPNLLSGECDRFLLDDVTQVGDVVLVEDESVIENEYVIVGLQTLVGYQVVTPGRRTIGKVRGYSFNINSGAVEALELDSFGISIIPSSLVSTYALFVEDVLEVVSDAVIVHEAAASRIHRLTKGFLDSQNVGTSIDELEEYSDFERPLASDKGTRRSSGKRKFNSRKSKNDDWDLPMDYF